MLFRIFIAIIFLFGGINNVFAQIDTSLTVECNGVWENAFNINCETHDTFPGDTNILLIIIKQENMANFGFFYKNLDWIFRGDGKSKLIGVALTTFLEKSNPTIKLTKLSTSEIIIKDGRQIRYFRKPPSL